MSRRERFLLLGVVAVVGLLVFRSVYGRIDRAFTERNGRIRALDEELGNKQLAIARGQRAARRIAEWEQRSLPSNLDYANSQYRGWLRDLVSDAGLSDPILTPEPLRSHYEQRASPGEVRKVVYDRLPTKLTATASLERITGFLHEFYSAGHLHQLRRIRIAPQTRGRVGNTDRSSELTFELDIDALVLPGADRESELSDEPGPELALGDLAAYRQAIVGRNFFAPPPPPPAPPQTTVARDAPREERFDVARFAKVTGITGAGSQWVINVYVQPTNRMLTLREGDEIEVGTFKGKITQINRRDVELEVDGKRFVVSLGGSLRDAVEVGSDDEL